MVLLKYDFIWGIINFVWIVWVILGFCVDVLCDVFIKEIILLDLKKEFKKYLDKYWISKY